MTESIVPFSVSSLPSEPEFEEITSFAGLQRDLKCPIFGHRVNFSDKAKERIPSDNSCTSCPAPLEVKRWSQWPGLHNPEVQKLLRIKCLWHRWCLDYKVVTFYVKHNSVQLFLTPFYSQPMRFAGTPAGTFWGIYQLKTDPFRPFKQVALTPSFWSALLAL